MVEDEGWWGRGEKAPEGACECHTFAHFNAWSGLDLMLALKARGLRWHREWGPGGTQHTGL